MCGSFSSVHFPPESFITWFAYYVVSTVKRLSVRLFHRSTAEVATGGFAAVLGRGPAADID